MPREEDRINALANYLEIDPAEIKEGYRENLFETEDGEEYFVVTEEEAYDLAKEDIENTIDDLGIDAFAPDFQDWIMNNAVDTSFLEDFVKEDYQNYASDIEYESDPEYGTRLAAECVEHGLISEDEFENGEYTGDEDLVELLSEFLFEDVSDYKEWFDFNFGKGELTKILQNNGWALDTDAIVDECISWDGVAHFISFYDGKEIELEDDLFAYRCN